MNHATAYDGARARVLRRSSAGQLLEELGQPAKAADGQTVHHRAELLLIEAERQVLACIEQRPTSIDQIIAARGMPAAQVLARLSVFEMRRLIRRVSGNLVARP